MKADWLELSALAAADRNSSIQDLVQVIRRSGSVDALEEPREEEEDEAAAGVFDRGSERAQQVAEDAFAEIEDRLMSCGGAGGNYPYEVRGQYISSRANPQLSVYVFLLLLSRFGKDAGPSRIDGAKLFEEVSGVVSQSYFGGGEAGVEMYLFGFPRRSTPASFEAAVNQLCETMGEGQGCQRRPNLGKQRDANLDLIVWRSFVDRRMGKLIGFGQCASGRNWTEKLGELLPRAFCETWLRDQPVHEPVRLFFVPFRVGDVSWMDVNRRGGILFDRCRIALHGAGVPADLGERCRRWSEHVLRKYLQS